MSKDLGLPNPTCLLHHSYVDPLAGEVARKVVKASGLDKLKRVLSRLVDYVNEIDSSKRDEKFQELFEIKQEKFAGSAQGANDLLFPMVLSSHW